jgi:hypothetical protein
MSMSETAKRYWKTEKGRATRRRNAKIRAKRYPELDHARKRRSVLRQYGLTIEQYEQMFRAQGGVCLLCGLPPDAKHLAVDHAHDTNEVRGLLHTSCNLAIGQLGDSSARAEQAMVYLRRFGK